MSKIENCPQCGEFHLDCECGGMSDNPLDNIESVRRVNIRPGDKIVIEYPGRLSQEAAARLGAMAKEFFGCPVLVLEDGLRVAVVGEADEILADIEGDPMKIRRD